MTTEAVTHAREKLCGLLDSLTDAERDYIAELDYGSDASKHRAAFDRIIAEGGVTSLSNSWFPCEVIELGRGQHPSGHERAYAACLGVLLLNIALGTDNVHDAGDELDYYSERASALPRELRALIAELFALCGAPPDALP